MAFLVVATVGALIVVVLAGVAGIYDLIRLRHLRRRITEAWQDLSVEP